MGKSNRDSGIDQEAGWSPQEAVREIGEIYATAEEEAALLAAAPEGTDAQLRHDAIHNCYENLEGVLNLWPVESWSELSDAGMDWASRQMQR